MSADERPAAAHTVQGKWSKAGVPKKGWECIGIDDLGSPSQCCEMCEMADIRYVHYMEHPDYPDVLGVGCICAEHLEEDYVRPKEREKRLRRAAVRRRSWAQRNWRLSERGSHYVNTEGYNLTVFQKGRHWVIKITNRASGMSQIGRKSYISEDEAKAAALNALLWAKEHLKNKVII
jgi:hypothetical protein